MEANTANAIVQTLSTLNITATIENNYHGRFTVVPKNVGSGIVVNYDIPSLTIGFATAKAGLNIEQMPRYADLFSNTQVIYY